LLELLALPGPSVVRLRAPCYAADDAACATHYRAAARAGDFAEKREAATRIARSRHPCARRARSPARRQAVLSAVRPQVFITDGGEDPTRASPTRHLAGGRRLGRRRPAHHHQQRACASALQRQSPSFALADPDPQCAARPCANCCVSPTRTAWRVCAPRSDGNRRRVREAMREGLALADLVERPDDAARG
jgi:hypothetical protein